MLAIMGPEMSLVVSTSLCRLDGWRVRVSVSLVEHG